MPPSVKHKFTSARPDGGDTSLIRPSNWNDEHDLTGLVLSVNGIVPDGSGDITVNSFGDETNNTTFEPDGTMVMNGAARVFDDILPIALYLPTGQSAPNITLIGGSGTIRAQEFPANAAGEEYNPSWQLSHRWKEGSDITPHLHLHVPASVPGGVINFQMAYTWTNKDGVPASEAIVNGSATVAPGSAANGNMILSFGPISAAGKLISSIFQARITRPATGTFAGSVWLKSADIHMECDTVGSRSEYTK